MFHDPAAFPFVRELQARWRLIRQEYLELRAPVLPLHRIGAIDTYVETLMKRNGWTPSWQVDSAEPNLDWLTYGLSYKGMLPDGADRALPATSRLLSRLEGCEVCALSLMRPGTFIAPHTHPEMDGRLLILHLGLDMAPGRSFLCVGQEVREERPGGVVVFNGAMRHFAVNMSRADRVLLYLEFDPRIIRFCD